MKQNRGGPGGQTPPFSNPGTAPGVDIGKIFLYDVIFIYSVRTCCSVLKTLCVDELTSCVRETHDVYEYTRVSNAL